MKSAKAVGIAIWLVALGAAYSFGASAPRGDEDAASLEAALADRNPLQRSLGLSGFLIGLGPDNITAALEQVEAQAYWFDYRDHDLLMDAWVRFDSQSAVNWAFERPVPLRPRATGAAIRALGFHDPAAARSMFETLDTELIEPLFHAMVEGWAWSDRKADLTSYLAQTTPGSSRQRATGTLATVILSDGVDELETWVEQAPTTERFRWLAFQKSAVAIAEFDPARAAVFVDAHLNQPYAKQGPAAVAKRWLESDPAAALSWLITLPEGADRKDRIKLAFQEWAEAEPEAARAWVLEASPDPAVDPAVRELVRRDFRSDPAAGLDWTHRIHDPVQRARVQASAGRAWYEKNPDTFGAWLPESGLDERIQDLILNTRERKRGGARAEQRPDAAVPAPESELQTRPSADARSGERPNSARLA